MRQVGTKVRTENLSDGEKFLLIVLVAFMFSAIGMAGSFITERSREHEAEQKAASRRAVEQPSTVVPEVKWVPPPEARAGRQ